MKTVLIGDDPALLEAVYACVEPDCTIITNLPDAQLAKLPAPEAILVRSDPVITDATLALLHGAGDVQCLLCFHRPADQEKGLGLLLKSGLVNRNCIVVQHGTASDKPHGKNGVVRISTTDLVRQQVAITLERLQNLQSLERLRQLNRGAAEVLILMQHDPDPDALASGLALRTLLDRNRQTAPLGTFGAVTRSENLNMMRMLDIPVIKLTADMLDRFSRIAMVDVQPPYFTDFPVRADMVFDHHPRTKDYAAAFADVRPNFGATSTILGQYLLDAGISIPQRLATALVYGIKTDTMSLERDITHADLEVFTKLYPLANINMIRQIETASLDIKEVKLLIKALHHLTMIGTMACTWLGTIKSEDMIPRLADFSLQATRAEWSFAAGVAQNMVICSARNVGYVKHAGELMRRVFGAIGSAGGHRSAAKAVIPLGLFKKTYGVRRLSEIPAALFSALADANR